MIIMMMVIIIIIIITPVGLSAPSAGAGKPSPPRRKGKGALLAGETNWVPVGPSTGSR